MRITLFTEELRKCLNAAGLSDCGENDAWSYWYNRVLKAHNDAVERQVVQVCDDGFNEGCEFQKVGSDGYPFCASATEIMRLRDVLESYAKTFDGWAAENNGGGRQMDGPDWLELANELRMERDGE